MNAFHSFSMFVLSAMLALNNVTPGNNVTIILLVDNSGSMNASDPFGLRYTAINMLAALSDRNDQLGVIGFSTQSQVLTNGLISPSQYQSIQPVKSDGYTDMQSALIQASHLLKQANPSNKISIILLTDGKPEIEHPYSTYQQETVELAHSLGVPIYAIALTPKADLSFLQQLTGKTGGTVFPAGSASDLLDAYLQVFKTIQDRTVLRQSSVSAPVNIPFEIDPALAPYIQKISFVLGKPETVHARLTSPDGTTYPFDLKTSDAHFVAVNVSHPQSGTWKFVTIGRGIVQAWAILYSRLRIQIVSPVGFQPLGESIPIVIHLIEERNNGEIVKMIGDVAFSAEITRPDGQPESLDRFYDDGTHGDLVANDGDYTRLYANPVSAGTYQMMVTAQKGEIPVSQQTSVQVIAFPKLVLDNLESQYIVRTQAIHLKAHFIDGSLAQGKVVAHIRLPSGQQTTIQLTSRDGIYTGEFMPPENGSYTVQIETDDAIYMGVSFQQTVSAQWTVSLAHSLAMDPPEIYMTTGCFEDDSRISVRLPLSSLRQEQISLLLPGFVLQPASFTIQPGQQQIVFEIFPPGQEFVSGDVHANLQIGGPSGLDIQPAATIPLNFSIPSRLERCEQPITWGVLGFFGMVVAGILLARQMRVAVAPPLVSGTLRWWAADQTALDAQECDLTVLAHVSITIGSNPNCALSIADGALVGHHATLLAAKTENGVVLYLEPVGKVKKGYVLLRTRTLLAHADQFCMGGLNFQYLSDSGE